MTPLSMRIPLPLTRAFYGPNSHGLYESSLVMSIWRKAESCPALAGVNIAVCHGCLTAYASTAPFEEDDNFDPHREPFLCPDCASVLYRCRDCDDPIVGEDYAYWYNREPVCSNCYTDSYFECPRCEETTHRDDQGYLGVCSPCSDHYRECTGCREVIHEESAYYDEDEDPDYENPLCYRCYNRDRRRGRSGDSRLFIEQNPPISPEQKEDIFRLISRPLPRKGFRRLTGNKDDYLIQKIIDEVGPVENPIYIYGLTDRPGFSLRASVDLLPIVKKVVGYGMEIPPEGGTRRLGISKSLRGRDDIPNSWTVAVIRSICSKIPSTATTERSLPTYPDDVLYEPSNWPNERAWDVYCGWREWADNTTWEDMARWDARPFEWPESHPSISPPPTGFATFATFNSVSSRYTTF